VRQGRTDAWIAHQLDVTVQQIQAFKREQDLPLTMAILVDVSSSVLPVVPLLTSAGTRFVEDAVRFQKSVAPDSFEVKMTRVARTSPGGAKITW